MHALVYLQMSASCQQILVPVEHLYPATISTPTRECVSSSRTEAVMETKTTLRLWNSATSTVILTVKINTITEKTDYDVF